MKKQQFQRDLVSYELEQSYLKHLTSLSTGSIIIIIAFLEKFFANPEWKFLVGVSIISFLLCIIGSVIIQFLSVIDVDKDPNEEMGNTEFIFAIPLTILAFGGFLSGVISLGAFALKNFY